MSRRCLQPWTTEQQMVSGIFHLRREHERANRGDIEYCLHAENVLQRHLPRASYVA